MRNKKEKIIAILLVVGLIVVTGAISYAAFRFSGLGSKVNTITTGAVTMSYTESSNVISMSGALPTTDATGKVRKNPGEYFDFTVSSSMSASTNINYEVAVEELSGNTFDGDYIKFYLTKVNDDGSETEIMTPSTYKADTVANRYTGRPANMMSLYTSSMAATETIKFRLRMYVDESYNPQGDGGNLTYQARVNVYGLAGDKIEQEPVALAAGLYAEDGTMLYTWDELVNDYGIDVEKDYMDENGDPTFTSVLEVPGVRFSYADESMSTLNNDLSRGTKLVVDDSVTKIGNSAFVVNSTLKEIVLPSSVTSIDDSAFYGCTGLTSVSISGAVAQTNVFKGNTSIESVTIGDGTTTIGEWAFYDCTGLTSITIPDSVTTIGEWAFCNCSSLTSINIPNSVTSIGERAFQGCTGLTYINIPNSVTEINSGTFSGCSGLASITIPDSVTRIGGYVFKGCTGLTSINIPDGVTILSNSTFEGCTGLTSINIPDSVKDLDYGVFASCTGLTSITIPDSVTNIGSSVFHNCTNLTTIYYSGTATGAPWGATNATVIAE